MTDYDLDSPENAYLIDPSLQEANSASGAGSINPAAIMGSASPSQHSPAHSPAMPQNPPMYSPNHSPNASLDPGSAAGLHHPAGQDWSGFLSRPSFQNHRRAPSEHSDVSPSSFIAQDSFDYDASHSPMLNAQQDSGVYPENLGIDRFTISDAHQQQSGISPRHSPYPSPRMSPAQHGLGMPETAFILPSNDGGNRFGPPVFNQGGGGGGGGGGGVMDMSAQMAPPEINVEFAPPSKANMDMINEPGFEGLSPPSRGKHSSDRSWIKN